MILGCEDKKIIGRSPRFARDDAHMPARAGCRPGLPVALAVMATGRENKIAVPLVERDGLQDECTQPILAGRRRLWDAGFCFSQTAVFPLQSSAKAFRVGRVSLAQFAPNIALKLDGVKCFLHGSHPWGSESPRGDSPVSS